MGSETPPRPPSNGRERTTTESSQERWRRSRGITTKVPNGQQTLETRRRRLRRQDRLDAGRRQRGKWRPGPIAEESTNDQTATGVNKNDAPIWNLSRR